MKTVPSSYYVHLQQLQEVDFVILELTLYLDTHPNDIESIKQYNHYVKERHKLKEQFEKNYGPLTNFGYSYTKQPWEWKSSPWPWQV
ncbi:cotJB protein [Bacillus coahuilensis m2-6]|uniref:CotJB protein n=1 Tax=Bacillus coahuilensis p1.1.43 TaxID=1150625 RepID=A0A147K905_9BACI|nr:spore coat protein CotJB [Bacillus coahuilensis]KUP06605.1 cotJB protein [Bacillus coahuilensis p1.1.43]KUP07805.1 cotJB protein [Bacillus coahuilensis m2-6]